MCPDDKSPGRFYCNFKIHKNHSENKAPPPRPITSGAGSITEGIATFVEHFIKDTATTHETYLQDTPDFLRLISQINKGPKLNNKAILATFDVEGLFTNIIHTAGLQCLQEQLQEQGQSEVPYEYIIQLMDIILHNNIFTFHDALWKQEVGAAMGSKPIPPYANIFLARTLDKLMKKLGAKFFQMLKRFLDDYFTIFVGTTKELHKLLEEINKVYPTIKLTLNHTSVRGELKEDQCECEEKTAIPFLDTLCSIKNGYIDTDLYKKPTDRNQYLLPSSCHPKTTTRAIPMSLGLRIIRICSDPNNRDTRLKELKKYLLDRGYNDGMVDTALAKAKRVPRDAALKKVPIKRKNKRPVFAVTYDPRLPSITKLQAKHWRTMVNRNQHLAEVFPSPPLTAYRRQPNLRSHLIRAKVAKAQDRYPKRYQRGMAKCNRQNCTACPFIKEGKNIEINQTKWNFNRQFNCHTYNLVYAIVCRKPECKEVYIGETKRLLKSRLAEHRGYVTSQDTSTATGRHYNSPGHTLADLSITVLEQVRKNDTLYRTQREEYHVRRFNTLYKGLNRQI